MTAPHYVDGAVTLWHGDALRILPTLPDCSVDAVVTDPPYGLEFMGREWDSFKTYAGGNPNMKPQGKTVGDASGVTYGYRQKNPRCRCCGKLQRGNGACKCPDPQWDTRTSESAYQFQAWCEEWAAECLRVLKPGGHLLAFGGTRTWHRLTCAIEDAGFEIRDTITWLYGSGFPKSLDVGKAIDKSAGAERQVVGHYLPPNGKTWNLSGDESRPGGDGQTLAGGRPRLRSESMDVTAPATVDAARWQGWGTALKPAFEPVVCAQKPAGHTAILIEIGSHLDRLEATCASPANDAAVSSTLTPAASQEVRAGSAPASAATLREGEPARATPTGEVAGSPAAMGTSASELADAMSLSTVSSWRQCLAVLWAETSTSTTGTTSSTTTDLRTLSSCLSRITGESMPGSPSLTSGPRSLVEAADNLFAAYALRSRATLALSAAETATGGTPTSRPGGPAPARTASEPVVVARKPLAGTVAQTVLAHGTGALNIDACRVGSAWENSSAGQGAGRAGANANGPAYGLGLGGVVAEPHPQGRWPANVVLTHGDCGDGCVPGCPVADLDAQSGTVGAAAPVRGTEPSAAVEPGTITGARGRVPGSFHGDEGGASRFFPTFRYQAKADTAQRPRAGAVAHPTVKPLDLMRWLVRLVTPPGGLVLDLFAGSGTTGEACTLEGFDCWLVEREADYLPLIVDRLTRRSDPVAHLTAKAARGEAVDLGLFADLEEGA